MGLIVPLIIGAAIGLGAAEYRHRKSNKSSRSNPDERKSRSLPRDEKHLRHGRKAKSVLGKR